MIDRSHNNTESETTMVSNSGVNTGCDKDGISTHPATIQTKLRLYLPPPIVKAIRDIDPQLEPYIGAEGCVNIFGTVCIGWIIYQLGRFFSRGGSGGSSTSSLRGIEAIQDNDNDCALMRSNEASSVSFDETVLFKPESKSTVSIWPLPPSSLAPTTALPQKSETQGKR